MSGIGKDPAARLSRPPMFDELPPEDYVFAGSVVEFTVWESTAEDGAVLDIDGPLTWRRPWIGTEDGTPIVVVDDDKSSPSAVMTAPNYLDWLFGTDLAEHIPKHSISVPKRANQHTVNQPTAEAPTIRKRFGLA